MSTAMRDNWWQPPAPAMSTPMRDYWRQPPPQDGYGLHNKIMLTAALSLGVVVILVVALHLYIRYVLHRRQAPRRTLTSLFDSGSGGSEGAASPEPPKAGLHPSVISALPTFSYKKPAARTAEASGAAAATAECAVCLCALEEGEVARLLPNCSHLFHAGCIDMWFASHSTCPICRAEAEPEPEPQPQCTGIAPEEVVASAAAAEGPSGPCKDQEGSSTSRLNASLRRMLSRGRSQRRAQAADGVVLEDLERQ